MSKVFTFTEDYSYYINAGIIEKEEQDMISLRNFL